ncbi:hypothetical protein EV360DRAFT_80597 [Lentinula raphanica]|nr:hypothetical protein EV360DRAFT_80597 [Lentinula raphanica]
MLPEQITKWLKQNYPKPQVHPVWLQACYDWIISEQNLNPATDMNLIIQEVETQLLESDLRDSMAHGTGIPNNLANFNTVHSKLTGAPILVQIEAITDVGVSAYSLNKTRLIREERQDAGEEQEGAVDEVDGEVEGEGPIPNYPRSMLKLELSDGSTTLRAAEYRPIPQLTLGKTNLGSKLQIHDAEVRRGIVLLEPRNITFKGHMVSDREVSQKADFARGLRRRLGLPDLEPPSNNPGPASNGRTPLREISPPPSPTLVGNGQSHSDDEDQPRRRRIPSTSVSTTSTTVVSSSLFNSTVSDTTTSSAEAVRQAMPLSPAVREPTIIESDDEDENMTWGTRYKPIKPLPLRARDVSSSSKSSKKPSTPSNGKGKTPAMESDYEDDMFEELPSSFYDEIDKVELAVGMKSLFTSTSGPSTSTTRGSSSISADNQAAARSSQVITSQVITSQVITSQVITIEDEDEDDKENVPVPTRHVRRRGGQPTVISTSDDILELSDSD